MVDPSHIGTVFPPFSYEVERSKIRELAGALGDPNPLYRDVEAARSAGFADLPAPPTLPTLFSFWADPPLLARLAQIGVEMARVLHAEEEYEYHAPVHAGDTIHGVVKIANIRSRRGMDMVNLEMIYTNQRDEVVVVARTMMIVRG